MIFWRDRSLSLQPSLLSYIPNRLFIFFFFRVCLGCQAPFRARADSSDRGCSWVLSPKIWEMGSAAPRPLKKENTIATRDIFCSPVFKVNCAPQLDNCNKTCMIFNLFFFLRDTWPAFSRIFFFPKTAFSVLRKVSTWQCMLWNSNFCSHITMWEKPVLVKSKSYRHSTLYMVPCNRSNLWWTGILLLTPIILHLKRKINRTRK